MQVINPQYFIVLEPFNHMLKVIEAAARRGYRVVVFSSRFPSNDWGPYIQGISSITDWHAISVWGDDLAAFQAIVERYPSAVVAGVYAGNEITLKVSARLRQYYGLATHSPEIVETILNKPATRRRLVSTGLSRLRVFDEESARKLISWPEELGPVFFKPITGAGSAYVKRCSSIDDIRHAFENWDLRKAGCTGPLREHLESSGAVFLEEAADGELVSLEGYCVAGSYTPLGLTSRTLLQRDVAIEMGAAFPYPHPLYEDIVAKVAAVHECLGFEHGASHTEIVVGDSGSIEIVELNPRFIGSDILLLMNTAFDIVIEDVLVDLALGRQPESKPSAAIKYASMQHLLPPEKASRIDSLEFPEGIDAFRIIKPIGSQITSSDFQTDHVAAFFTSGNDFEALLETSRRLAELVKFNGVALGRNPNNSFVEREGRGL